MHHPGMKFGLVVFVVMAALSCMAVEVSSEARDDSEVLTALTTTRQGLRGHIIKIIRAPNFAKTSND